MTRTPAHALAPERKIAPVLEALRGCYGLPKRPGRDPLEVLIRGVLSQNTSDLNSALAYGRLRETFGDWQAVADAPRRAVERAIRPGGLAAQKAACISAVLSWLSGRGGYCLEFLRDMDAADAQKELTSIRGVGIKTARLVLLFGFGRPVSVVDTHVHRVARRLGLIPARCTRQRAHLLLDDLVPNAAKYSAHMNMILHGRRLCHARAPDCEPCPVRRWCVLVRGQGPVARP